MRINDDDEGNNNNLDTQNNKNLPFSNSLKFKTPEGANSNKRYYQNEEDDPQSSLKNEFNYIEIFNNIVKSIDKIIFQKVKDDKENENENNQTHQYRKSSFIYDSINEEDINYDQLYSEGYNIIFEIYSENKNLLLIKNKYDNNLAQYYINSGLILVSLEIIKIYYKILKNEIDGEEKFFKWLINDNNDGENILEKGICIQTNPKDQICFYGKIFELIDSFKNKKVIYKILENRKENIFALCAKEEKLFLLLFLYEKVKKYYPSSNPLNIKSKSGLTPLHLSCYYLSREITDILLILKCKVNITDNNENIPLHFAVKGGDLAIVKKLLLYGSDKNKENNKQLTPIDFANKYGNYSMKNLFTNNPIYKIETIKGKNNVKLLMLFFSGCFILKYLIYNYFWKSYVIDIICFSFFLYFVFKSKDYYFKSDIVVPQKDNTIEKLLEECAYDKNKVKRICPKCKLIRNFEMKHCMVCDLCVDDFDHHCFWINKCINNNIYYQFIAFLIVMLIDIIINFYLFFIEVKNSIKIKNDKNIIYYLNIIFLNIYLFIFAFGILMISRMLWERIKGKLYSNKKLTLEENLLNKKNVEDECNDENKEIKNNNNIENNENNYMKLNIKGENKDEEIEFKDLKI